MNQFKRAQIIALQVNKAKSEYHQIVKLHNKELHRATNVKSIVSRKNCEYYEMYVVSDDKPRNNDWCIHLTTLNISQSNDKDNNLTQGWKKIIATTDTSLFTLADCPVRGAASNIKYILPQPSQQFIEKYVESYNKGEVITNVLVEYENHSEGNLYGNPMMIKPELLTRLKVNPKDNTITIKKLKDSWNKEEVIKLIEDYSVFDDGTIFTRNKWINENL